MDGGYIAPANNAIKYAMTAMRSEYAKLNADLAEDFTSVLEGQCIYLPNFLCSTNDLTIYNSLKDDLMKNVDEGMIKWSKHLKHENPEFSETFTTVVTQLAEYFDAEVYATRLNYYCDGSDWKPFHHDSHAYGGKEQREDFTIGISFGGQRELQFLHEASGHIFGFPQKNGDVFAFTTDINKRFKHGVPKAKQKVDERFSIIVWGRRRTLTSRNGGRQETFNGPVPPVFTRPFCASQFATLQNDIKVLSGQLTQSLCLTTDNSQLQTQVRDDAKKVAKRKGRVQGGSSYAAR